MLKDHDGHTKLDLNAAKDETLQEFDKNFKTLENTEKTFKDSQISLKLNHDESKKEIENYFSAIRDSLKNKENEITQKLQNIHSMDDNNFNIEIKKLSDRLLKMKNETNFVEKLKLKISAKFAIQNLETCETPKIFEGYTFDSNSAVISLIQTLHVKESEKTLTLGQLKSGSNTIATFKPFNSNLTK